MYHVYFMEEKSHKKESDDITKIHINLAYLQKIDYTDIEISGNKLMKDLYFLSCGDNEKLDIIYEGDSLMEKIIKEAKEIAGTMELDLYATDEELRQMDQEEYYQNGLKAGIREGIEQNKKEMVINMYKKSFDIKTISQITNLTIDDVKKIIDN